MKEIVDSSKKSGLFNTCFFSLLIIYLAPISLAAMFFYFPGYLEAIGVDKNVVGVIVSADALASLVVQLGVSAFINTTNVRKWLVLGVAMLFCGIALLSKAVGVPVLVMGRLLQGSGFVVVLSSLIVVIVNHIPPAGSGAAFGLISLSRLVPYAAIPVTLEMSGVTFSSFPRLFPIMLVLTAVPLAACLVPLPAGAPPGMSRRLGVIQDAFSDRRIVLTMLSSFLLFSGYSGVFFYVRQYGEGIGLENAGLFLTFETAGMFVVRLVGAQFSDNHDKVRMTTAGILVCTVCYALIPFAGATGWFFVLSLICGLCWGVAMPVQSAYLFDISEPAKRGVYQNLLLAMMQAGFFVGSLCAGQVIAVAGFTAYFLVIAAITLLSALSMLSVGTRRKVAS